ncbi:MAG: RNA polymerase sigma factor [Phycisphaerae bacterium]
MTCGGSTIGLAEAVAIPGASMELAEGLARGDRGAFERLVTQHHDQVAGLAYRLLGWSDEVHDVVQDVFLSALANARHFRGQSEVGTWLTTITLNTCRKRWRRALIRRKLLPGLRLLRASGTAHRSDRKAMSTEVDGTVQDAVRALPMGLREVIVLHYLEQKPVEQVATLLGIKRNAVEVRLVRARDRLRNLLMGVAEGCFDAR